MVSLNISKASKTLPSLDASNLSSFLKSQLDEPKRTFYLYGDLCQHVKFVPELSEDIVLDSIAFSQKTKAFWFDNYGTLQELNFAPMIKDNSTLRVCLKFDLFKNQSTSALIIKSDRFYYHSFFEEPKSFESLQEAKEHIKRLDINPENLRLYR